MARTLDTQTRIFSEITCAQANLLSCPFSIGSHENSPPDFLFPVGGADAGMHGGERALSDG
jgi:hypothetical protein